MKSITNIDFIQLRNDEILGFWNQVADKTSLLTEKNDKAFVDAFINAVKTYEVAFKPTLSNSFTQQRKEADDVTEDLWKGLRLNVESMIYFPRHDIQLVAQSLFKTIRKYGSPASMSYKEQYPNLRSMLNELANESDEHKKLLGLNPWLIALEQAYTDFMAISADKVKEESHKMAGAVQETRSAGHKAYQALIARINAGAIYVGTAAYEAFIDEVEVIIGEYRSHLAARKTRKTNKSINAD